MANEDQVEEVGGLTADYPAGDFLPVLASPSKATTPFGWVDVDRTVAGLKGREIWIAVALPGKERQVRFTRHFAGVEPVGTKAHWMAFGRRCCRR